MTRLWKSPVSTGLADSERPAEQGAWKADHDDRKHWSRLPAEPWTRVVTGHSPATLAVPAKRLLVSGHRGDCVRAPEQTMAAFVDAVRAGADAIEMDVQWTTDQRMVLIHDDTVDRTTSSTGRVTEMTYTEIRACDAGSWFLPQFRGAQVPAFEEVLAFAAQHRRLLINAEIKNADLTPAQASAYLDAVRAAGVDHRTIASSFYPSSLATFRAADPERRIPSGLIASQKVHTVEEIQASGSSYYMPRWWELTSQRAQEVKAAGIQLWLWPVITESDFESVCAFEPDAVVVDSVSDFRRWYAARHPSA